MGFIGIDIGSTCAKTIVIDENSAIVYKDVCPTMPYIRLRLIS